MKLPEDVIDRLLDTWPVARLATLPGRGAPQQVPVVFARSGEVLWSPVDAKPKGGGELARVRNIRADPRVSLLLDHYDSDWSRLWWIRIDTEARVIRPARPDSDPECAAAVAALERKYSQYAHVPVLGKPATLLALRPRGIRSWCWGSDAISALERSFET